MRSTDTKLSGEKCVVLFSGGMDSTICLFLAMRDFGRDNVVPLSIWYGQRHDAELDSVFRIREYLDETTGGPAQWEEIRLPVNVLASTSPLVNEANQVETYDSVEALPSGEEATFIPHRNLLFLTLAANRAVSLGARSIMIGVSAEDNEGYPDCRQDFLSAAIWAIRRSVSDRDYKLQTPLLGRSKASSLDLARLLPGCWEALGMSHTCYNGVYPPCGRCHACLLRAKAFADYGEPDPLLQA